MRFDKVTCDLPDNSHRVQFDNRKKKVRLKEGGRCRGVAADGVSGRREPAVDHGKEYTPVETNIDGYVTA